MLPLQKYLTMAAAAAAKSLQLCPTLCDPIDGSPQGSPIPGILQARTLEWVAAPSKQFVASPMEKLRNAEGSVYPGSPDNMVAFSPVALEAKEGASGPWRRGMAQGSTGVTAYQVGLEMTEQAYVAETWWLGVGQKGTSSPWST